MSATLPRPRQSLGQNFLVDPNIARKIVRAVDPAEGDVVVEIGPGHGALTGLLAGSPCRLVLVEIDRRLTAALAERFPPPRTEVVEGDFLDVPLADLAARFGRRLRVVGNIPYHLTSPILFRLFDEFLHVADCTLMVQKEVAARIVARPGVKDYGILSVMTRLHGEPKVLFDVSPHCFFPKPRVTSSIVRVAMRAALPEGVDLALLREVVRGTFGKRRKTLRNSLRYLADAGRVPGEALSSPPVALDLRPEQLTPEDFVSLARHIGSFR